MLATSFNFSTPDEAQEAISEGIQFLLDEDWDEEDIRDYLLYELSLLTG